MSRHRASTARIVRLLLLTCLLPACLQGGPHPAGQGKNAQKPAKKKAPGAKITCAQPAYDFGKVEEGKQVTHVFTIKNEGDGVLQILRTSAG